MGDGDISIFTNGEGGSQQLERLEMLTPILQKQTAPFPSAPRYQTVIQPPKSVLLRLIVSEPEMFCTFDIIFMQ